MIDNLIFAKPEMFLSILAMVFLMVGVFNKNRADITQKLFGLTAVGLLVAIYFIFCLGNKASASSVDDAYNILAFNRGFIFDNFAYALKILVCVISAGVCIIAMNNKFYAGSSNNVFEFPVLVILSVIGMFVLISATDLMTFYVGLELQSLSLYVLVAINRDSESSTESAVKYFVLGALASGIILFGASMIYGFSGATNLGDIAALMKMNESVTTISPGIIFGFVLVLAGLFFKLSAVPMHMWAPDVYEGATKSVVTLIATAPKVAAIAFLVRFLTALEPEVFDQFKLIIVLVAAASMILGAFAALRQTNIKRLLAYSSISNMGYILVALSIGTQTAIESAVLYLIIYMIGSIGIFAVLSMVQNKDGDLEQITDLSGLARSNPVIATALAILMFSIAGIPPMAGFFGKFFVFKEAVLAGYITLAIVGVVTSVVAAFYYLKIVKVMYFEDTENSNISADQSISLRILVAFSAGFTLLMILFTSPILNIAKNATKSLF